MHATHPSLPNYCHKSISFFYILPSPHPQSYFLDLEKEIREDLNLCNSTYTEYNAISHHYEILKKRLNIMQEYIPANYSGNFRNPCWYDFHQNFTNPKIPTSHPCKVSLWQWSKHVQAEQVLRQLKAPGERHLYYLPTFFVPAFPKCATTALYYMIIQHPLIAKNRCKENWFWNSFINEEGTDIEKRIHPLWYFYRLSQSIHYIESNPLSISLDASPVYAGSFTDNFCMLPTLLKRVLPEAKYILILRNPSKRFFSHYWFQQGGLPRKRGIVKLTQYVHTPKAVEDFHNRTVDAIMQFQSCIDGRNSVLYCVINERRSKLSIFLYWGLYYYHIVPWLKIIPHERFLFLRTEDLAKDQSLTLSKVWHFLHLDDFQAETSFTNVNKVQCFNKPESC